MEIQWSLDVYKRHPRSRERTGPRRAQPPRRQASIGPAAWPPRLPKRRPPRPMCIRDSDMSARGVEVALTGRAPSRKIVEKADYITEMRCEKHPYEQGICAREGVEY